MHGAQQRKFAVHAGPSIARSGLYTVNKLLTVLHYEHLCIEPQCFCEDKASYSKMQIMPYYVMSNHHLHDIMSCVGIWSN